MTVRAQFVPEEERERHNVVGLIMKTLRLTVDAAHLDCPESLRALETAAEILRKGGLVALPTETVYGLGANALDADAVQRIFAAKQRPSWDPLIVHIADEKDVEPIVTDIPRVARLLMSAFWPGPLTLLLPRAKAIPSIVTAGRDKVGLRMPAHPVARALIRQAGLPIAAPSANAFGRTSPTRADHVLEDLDGRIDAILDSGETTYGLESTVVDPTLHPPVMYRPGMVTLEQLRAVCGEVCTFSEQSIAPASSPESLPSPGVGIRHYAPRARLVLIEGNTKEQQEQFAKLQEEWKGERIGLMLPEGFLPLDEENTLIYRWGRWGSQEQLAQRLFAGLRELDARGVAIILCPLPSEQGVGLALRDRLRKAAREK
jgi:L-threonylcarbamoyladenylate synthase